mgnify:CR=1 FL=1
MVREEPNEKMNTEKEERKRRYTEKSGILGKMKIGRGMEVVMEMAVGRGSGSLGVSVY